MFKLPPNLLQRGAEFCWGVIVLVHRDVVIDAAASLCFFQSKAGEDHIGNMVLGDRNLPDSLLVDRVCPVVDICLCAVERIHTLLIIFCLSAVISIQVIDMVWVG